MFKTLLINQFAGPLIRHGATILGGWLIASGYADDATVQQITGGLVALGGVGLSFVEKAAR